MNARWKSCKRILCIRPDNMGDLLMTSPALRALKETFGARITVLTSSMAAGIAGQIQEIDATIVFDVPWVKAGGAANEQAVFQVVQQLKDNQFDAAVIFTVYSQNPMPAIMLAYLAGIPLRLAYCRENPYQLLTDWVPDTEPYTVIKHQVRRDLDLVAHIGALPSTEQLSLTIPVDLWPEVKGRLQQQGFNPGKPWLIMHPGVSESKREYPAGLWASAIDHITAQTGYQVLLTGSAAEAGLTAAIHEQLLYPKQVFPVAGLFTLNEFIVLIEKSPILVSVNTGTIHIAAATGTPVVVLYALTNPQHTPWQVYNQILPYTVPVEAQSKNEIIRYVNRLFNTESIKSPVAEDILSAVQLLLSPDAQHFRQGPVTVFIKYSL